MSPEELMMLLYQARPDLYARDIIGITLWQKQLDILNALRDYPATLVTASHGVGKCLAENEMVRMADGSFRRAGDLVGRQFSVLTLDPAGNCVPAFAVAEWNSASEPVLRLTTSHGKSVVRNAQHPLYAARKVSQSGRNPVVTPLGFTPIGDLSEGDLVAVPDRVDTWPNRMAEPLPETHVKFLAYMIGDGGMTESSATFTQMENAQLSEMRAIAGEMGFALVQHKSCNNPHTFRLVATHGKGTGRKNGNPATCLLRQHGLMHKHGDQKFVPEAILSADLETVRLFLNRLYSTDGWACVSANGCSEIGFCSNSRVLCDHVADLLLRFGLHASVKAKPKTKAYSVTLRDCRQMLAFCREIGIYGKEAACARVEAECLSRLKDKRIQKWTRDQAPAGCHWEVIESITLEGECATVAIEVPHFHTFLSGLWEHNSTVFGTATNWKFDCFPDSKTITSAPTQDQVEDVLWGEIRRQRGARPGLLPKKPEMQVHANWWAKGRVTANPDAGQGRHAKWLTILFDECVGIPREYWIAANGMLSDPATNRFGGICNPTDITSYAYEAYKSGTFHLIQISAFEHPNVLAALAGQPVPYPGAVTVDSIERDIAAYCEPLATNDVPLHTDFQWPPESGRWFRPGPIFEGRVLGRWPTQAVNAVWSMSAWERCLVQQAADEESIPEIGVDVARKGDDETWLFLRRGRTFYQAERRNGLEIPQVARLCKEVADAWGEKTGYSPFDIPIRVDDSGVGGGVTDLLVEWGYNAIPVVAQSKAVDEKQFPRRRSELWFTAVSRARQGEVDVSRLPREAIDRLQVELFAPTWEQDADGRRKVEEKKITKQRLRGRSPDAADAFNLCLAQETPAVMRWVDGAPLTAALDVGRKGLLVDLVSEQEAEAALLHLRARARRLTSSARSGSGRYDPFRPRTAGRPRRSVW